MNPDAVFLVPRDPATRTAFEQLAARDFEDDTALYALPRPSGTGCAGRRSCSACTATRPGCSSRSSCGRARRCRGGASFLGYAYAGLGRKADAIREGTEAERMLPSAGEPVLRAFAALALARIYAMVDERDAALRQLELLLSTPSPVSVALLRVDPTWERVRKEPEFEELLRRHEGNVPAEAALHHRRREPPRAAFACARERSSDFRALIAAMRSPSGTSSCPSGLAL